SAIPARHETNSGARRADIPKTHLILAHESYHITDCVSENASIMQNAQAQKSDARSRSAERKALRAILKTRGISIAELGRKIGCRADNSTLKVRRRIELFLTTPVWTTAKEFKRLEKLRAIL